MFRCGICGNQSGPNEKAFRVVIERRPAIYPPRPGVYKRVIEGKKHFEDDPGGRGVEIAKEVTAHERCAKEFYATK